MIAKAIRILKYKYFPSEQDKVMKSWRKTRGDVNLIPVHDDLNENSFVMDIGGYHGDFSAEIYARYCCEIKVFEPVPSFVESMRQRFAKNRHIEVIGIGLGGETRSDTISINEYSSSTFRTVGCETTEIQIMNIVEWLDNNSVEKVAMMKINIEGGEYGLLDQLLRSKYISKIDNLQIQFHNFFENAVDRMTEIQRELSKTHEPTFQYRFVWENWKLKSK